MAQLNDLLVLGKTSLIGDVSLSSKLNIGNIIVQGSPSSDTTIANMNRFQTDLFVQGNGSAPNSPKVAGFYLGKSTSDENRHMDIVSGGDYAYIDFNKASVVEDYKARILVNVSSGYTEFNWASGATNKKFQINGALGVSSGLTVTGNASITNLLTVGSAATHYGIKVGDVYINAISGNLIFQNLGALRFGADSWDYNVWAGLKYDSSNKIIYLGLADGTVFTTNASQSGGNLSLPGVRYFTVNGKQVIDAGDAWLRINGTGAHSSGIYFGASLTRTDGQFQVGSGGANFYANNSGNGYFSNTLGIAGTNTTYKLYVNGISYFNGRMVIKGDGSSYNEGLRILPASNGWSNIFFSADTSLSGAHDGGWLIGRRGAAGSVSGAIGDFTIEEQDSSGVNLTIHKDSNGATLQGLMRSTVGFQVQRTAGDGCGLGLYGSSGHNSYGIHMSRTASYGTFGHVTGDWATYFCFEGNVNRGWIFKHAGSNVFSINGSGTLSTRVNNPAINFRPDNVTYYTTASYQTAGNEALVFAAKNAVTSFIFVNGEDSITNNASDRWYSLTPGLQVKNNCVAIGKLIASGTIPTYKLEVAGTSYFTGKMQVNAPIFGYNYTNSNNAAAFIWDKPGSNYTGMGANGASDTIYFSACTIDGSWVPSYKQKWVFNGAVSADTVAGAVWNDYAEYRDQIETIEPGYCVASTNSGKIYKTTEKFQTCDGIVSDTFGFAIGQTEESKTPLAVAGRVLAYCEGNRYDYNAGDTVCAGPDGKVCKMTRDEIKEYPDRIIGHVSEIPEYEIWGTGNVQVNGRIWIKIK